MIRIGTEGYEEFVDAQNERKAEKPKRITLKSGRRIRVYCGCTSLTEWPWREAWKKGTPYLSQACGPCCDKCNYQPWTFTKLNENEV
jgi:hypothetical protein